MARVLVGVLAWAVFAVRAIAQETVDLKSELPRIAATEPADAIRTFKWIDGLRIELVAAEPLVSSPVDMSFDEQGRLWVVEMNDYPYGPAEGNAPQGRVRVLEDDDGDGRMDRSHVLVDKLAWPTGLALWDGGCFVAAAPDIYYFKDTDGDHAADVRELVFSGFGKQNVQALLNNIKWGVDNWFYGAGGPNGGQIVSPGSDRAALNLGARDFRFRPGGALEPLSGGGQFGHSMDDFGRRFVCSNSNHARHVVLENCYLARNPALAVPAVIHSIASDGDQAPVYRLSPAEPWRIVRTRLRVSGQVPGPIEHGGKVTGYFTSATGITVYRGTGLGEGFYGNLFIGDVASNLVHRKALKADGVTFVADRVEREHEFLASTDTWFRPCNFANGPDGALYICDIYREVVEHPASIPEIIKKHLDLTSGKERGRIWRVTGRDAAAYRKPALGAGGEALVEAMSRRDGWWRETAGRLIFERQDKSLVAALERMAAGGSPESRVAALWALDGLDSLKTSLIAQALDADSEDVRTSAIRMAESRIDREPALVDRLVAMGDDASIRVRFQLASTMGQLTDARAADVLGRLAERDGGNVWCRSAILSSLGDVAGASGPGKAQRLLTYATAVPDRAARVSSDLLAQLVVLIGTRNRSEEVRSAVEFITADSSQESLETQWAMLRGLAEGRRRGGKRDRILDLSDLDGASAAAVRVNELLARAAETARDERAPLGRRTAAAQLLGYGRFSEVEQSLAPLLHPRTPQSLQLVAVRSLSAFSEPGVAPLLLAPWQTYTPPVRREALEGLLSRPERVARLLDAIDDGTVRRGDIEVDRRAQLMQHRDARVQSRARELLGAAPSADRGRVIDEYRKALEGAVDAMRGKEMFKKHCATCHRFQGEGTEVGPDLRTVQERTPEQLLEQILDPAREVNPAFLNYSVALADGRVVTGIIAGESATSVTLKRAEGAVDTILRSEIEEMRSSGLSLMPEGLEKDISPQQLADVIAYIRKR